MRPTISDNSGCIGQNTGCIGPFKLAPDRHTITVEPGALDDMPVIALINFLYEHGLRLDSDMVIRRVKE